MTISKVIWKDAAYSKGSLSQFTSLYHYCLPAVTEMSVSRLVEGIHTFSKSDIVLAIIVLAGSWKERTPFDFLSSLLFTPFIFLFCFFFLQLFFFGVVGSLASLISLCFHPPFFTPYLSLPASFPFSLFRSHYGRTHSSLFSSASLLLSQQQWAAIWNIIWNGSVQTDFPALRGCITHIITL